MQNDLLSLKKNYEILKDLKKEEGVFEKKETESLEQDLKNEIIKFKKHFKKVKIQTFLVGKYDKLNAILTIYAGAGGRDAQDWAAILLRMYERYAQNQNWDVKILHKHFTEEGGIKTATLEIKGKYAYGYLKKETGVHRLVRISPFSAKNLRHTSFAMVEVIPEIDSISEKEIEIKPEDLKIDTYRASGPGGQYVNKRETAVRITYLPLKIVVSCQSERSQGANREKALKILKAKLLQFKESERKEELEKTKANSLTNRRILAEWGNQIRSYIMHPYKLVKDNRTGIEVLDVDRVLDGELDDFIEAEIIKLI